MVKVKEKYFKTKYRPACMLLNAYTTIYFKFRNNKNDSYITVNFHTGL